MSMLHLFDHYSFRARLQPAFLALVPLAVGAFACAHPGAKWATALWSLLGSAGFTFFLANVARNRGKALESALWKSWGGAPTTLALRHSGQGNSVLRECWHEQLKRITGLPLPTAEQEARDPQQADEIYDAVTRIIIGKMRDTKAFPFVYRDNVNYGFCRNLYALRPLGLMSSVLGLCLCMGAAGWKYFEGANDYVPWAGMVICVGLGAWFYSTVTAQWVRVPAMTYSQHLMEGMEKLEKPKAVRKPKSETGAKAESTPRS